jgi:beta-lactamase class A
MGRPFRHLSIGVLVLTTACGATAVPATSTQGPPVPSPPLPSTVAPLAPTTSSPPISSTTTSGDPIGCRADPFAGTVGEELAADYPSIQLTAYVYDLRTGCEYSLNPENRQSTASVFKVLVMAGTLLQAQREGREVSEWEMSQLTPMITRSTNPPVRALWRSFGGSPWFRLQGQIFGLTETAITADGGSAWGLTTTSATDQVYLLRQLLIGDIGPLSAPYREVALELMLSVVPEQTWGITAGVPVGWRVAQKNGFAGITINSVGWVDEPGESLGYLVAILTQGWPDHPSGIAAVERVSRLIADSMTR